MPEKPAKYTTPNILSDLPIDVEKDKKANELAKFDFKEYAITLARLIADKNTKTPLTVGVSGVWGTGKTTLLKLVKEMLDQTVYFENQAKDLPVPDFIGREEEHRNAFRNCKTVWFNAWKYADEDELLVALVRVIVQTMYADGFISGGAAAIFGPFKDRRDVIDTVLSWFSIKTPFGDVKPGLGEAKPAPLSEKIAVLDLFNEAFNRLMAVWVHRTTNADVTKIDPQKGVLVIFIDDLDRCLPEKTVQVLEAIKLFLDKPGCVFVLGADVSLVYQAVREHYKSVAGYRADDYIEKIIQLRFSLPPIGQERMDAYVRQQISAGSPLYKHWKAIVAGAESNLRKVKTSLNDLQLRWAVMQNTGETENIDFDLFVGWEVLMRSSSRFRERMYGIRPENDLDYELVKELLDNAYKWAEGDDNAGAGFKEDVNEQMRRVLREIAPMRERFNRQAFESLLYMTTPLPEFLPNDWASIAEIQNAMASPVSPAQPKGEELPAEPVREEAYTDFSPAAKSPTHGGAKEPAGDANTLIAAGMEFKRIAAGAFLMGSKNDDKEAYDDEKPQHTVDIPYDYWLARFPLTNEQYNVFVKSSGGKHPVSGWEKKKDHPLVSVSWEDAQMYAKWLNDNHAADLPKGYVYRLPTEVEWEKAARGAYGNIYPWGNEFDKNKCNSAEGGRGGTTPVGVYSPAGDSSYGCADMSGNVWEWTHSLFEKYPYKVDDGRDDEKKSGDRVVRGGSFLRDRQLARCASRNRSYIVYRYDDRGFRFCLAPVLTTDVKRTSG